MYSSLSTRPVCAAAMLLCAVVVWVSPIQGESRRVIDIEGITASQIIINQQATKVNTSMSAGEEARQIVDTYQMSDTNGNKTGFINMQGINEYAKTASPEVRALIWTEIKNVEITNHAYENLVKTAGTMGSNNTTQATMYLGSFSKKELDEMKDFVPAENKKEFLKIMRAVPESRAGIQEKPNVNFFR